MTGVARSNPSPSAKAILEELAAIMDYAPDAEFGCGNDCEGCRAEMVEASRLVAALVAAWG